MYTSVTYQGIPTVALVEEPLAAVLDLAAWTPRVEHLAWASGS